MQSVIFKKIVEIKRQWITQPTFITIKKGRWKFTPKHFYVFFPKQCSSSLLYYFAWMSIELAPDPQKSHPRRHMNIKLISITLFNPLSPFVKTTFTCHSRERHMLLPRVPFRPQPHTPCTTNAQTSTTPTTIKPLLFCVCQQVLFYRQVDTKPKYIRSWLDKIGLYLNWRWNLITRY